MKVLLVNGSPHKNGCTYTALCEIKDTLLKNGVESEIFNIGTSPVRGCAGCGGCAYILHINRAPLLFRAAARAAQRLLTFLTNIS